MKLENIFSSFVTTDILDIDNDSIYSYCKQIQKERGLDDVHQHHLSMHEPELIELYNAIEQRLPVLNQMFALKDGIEQRLFNGWVNYETGKTIVKPHNHARQFLTIVYYVYASKNSGELYLMNPNDSHTYVVPSTHGGHACKEWNEYNNAIHIIKPEPKKLVIFPSWIFHYVVPCNTERISVAFNTRLFAGSYDLNSALGM